MTIISFSFTSVARLGVPPGKWFCLARTGLGYSQYSCCVCGMHHEKFSEKWLSNRFRYENTDEGWRSRLEKSIDDTLKDLGYYEKTETEVGILKSRISDLIFKPENYIINQEFSKLLKSDRAKDIRILTNGPRCLVRAVFPQILDGIVFTEKSHLDLAQVRSVSDLHVGTNEGDLRIPQTRYIISRKTIKADGAKIFPRLDQGVMQQILSH